MKATLLAVIIALGAASTAQAQPPYEPFYGAPYPQPHYQPNNPYGPGYGRGGYGRGEALYAIEAGRDMVRIRVSSNGCTRRSDFQARGGGTSYSPTITFVRVRSDNCRAFAPGGVWLDFSYRELGLVRGESFSLGNALTPWIGPGR